MANLSALFPNVLRYTALAGGVTYGLIHQRSIWSTQAAEAAERKYQSEVSLIEKAKQEYHKKTNPHLHASGVITNPDDPKFDLEAFLKSKE